jgi:hypothetical protein
MFRPSDVSTHKNLFTCTHDLLLGNSLKLYDDSDGWHNQFRRQIIERIDENLFRPLFSSDMGAPNVSIRVLVGMMILKEARGWSDWQLFEHCQFDLLTRSALGMMNLDDSVPAASTYYLLRKRIVAWEKSGHENLIEKVFSQITKSQSIDLQVAGKNVRMDSKLLGSNIAWYSRYELIHETLRKAYQKVVKSALGRLSLSESDIILLESLLRESGDKVSYRSSKSEIESKMAQLGVVIYKIITQLGDHPLKEMQTLYRVFAEQYHYHEQEAVALPLPKEEISSGSVQSPHDTECHYRQKDEKKVKGYSINVAETCDAGNQLNLITNVLVDVASAADCHFLQPALQATQEIVTQEIEIVNADGAYHSVSNQDYCRDRENPIDLVLGAIQGKSSRYDLTLDDDNELIVTDIETNTIIPVRKVESRKEGTDPKWVIKNEKNKNRYFTQKEIDTCSLRKLIGTRTQRELNVRNNVEATIFQLGYHYSNAKSRYRGLSKHKIWANIRCLWVNFVRIVNFMARNGSNYIQKMKNCLILCQFSAKYIKNIDVRVIAEIFYQTRWKTEVRLGFF